MPVLKIIYDVDGWAYHNCAKGLAKYAPGDFDVTFAPITDQSGDVPIDKVLGDDCPDLFFVLDTKILWTIREVCKERGWKAPIVGAYSAGWPHQIETFAKAYRAADALLVSNRETWRKMGVKPNTFTLPYGVDHEMFHVTVPPEARAHKVIWTGSRYYSEVKGYDDFVRPLQDRLRAKGIEFETRLVDSYDKERFTAEEMAEWYNSATVIVCASSSEGTPNPLLEAAACGCTIVSTAVGNMPELIDDGVNGYLVPRSVGALEEGVDKAIKNYAHLSKRLLKDIQPWLWQSRAKEYFDIFREVIETGGVDNGVYAGRKPVDIYWPVTVFVTTVGAPTFEQCLERLAQQDSLFRIEIVENVAPLTDALQYMLDKCFTKFFVQLDEDMLLYPHAIRSLHEGIAQAGRDVAMYVGNLFDVHLGRTIQGIKICRREIVQNYPWEPDTSVFQRNRAMRDDGYRIITVPLGDPDPDAVGTLGLHGTEWTPRLIYERYFTLRKWRSSNPDLDWIDEYGGEFLARFRKDPNEENFFSLMGFLGGALAGDRDPIRQKDFRSYDGLPGFEILSKLYAELGPPRTDGGVVDTADRSPPVDKGDGGAGRSPKEGAKTANGNPGRAINRS